MSEPEIIVWNCGENAHGQPIKVTRYKKDGAYLYRIDREAANQRDDCAWIGGLTVANLGALAAIVGALPPKATP